MNVPVKGGDRYTGSAVTERLLGQGHKATVLDNRRGPLYPSDTEKALCGRTYG